LIRFIAETGSTNADLLAAPHVAEGEWLVAHRQTAGRGRAGRAWNDGAGNFMGSTVVVLRPGDPPAQTLALVAGLATHRAVGQADGLLPKWPNDLLVNGAKLGGILLERQGERVVVGIGVNLAQAPEVPDRRTVALAALGPARGLDEFAADLAGVFAAVLLRWHAGEWPAQRSEWMASAHPVGTLLTVNDREQGPLTGAFAGVGDDGTLHLRLADGTVRPIHAGDVELVG
jgi:BirA family biotin operon repressor/biotin-[acetyl-CoA-carboxylase] ligase